MPGTCEPEFIVVTIGCNNCGRRRSIGAEYSPQMQDFGVHPVEEYLCRLWAQSHVGPISIISYDAVLAP